MASSLTLSFLAQWGGMVQHATRVQHHTLPGKNPEPRQRSCTTPPRAHGVSERAVRIRPQHIPRMFENLVTSRSDIDVDTSNASSFLV